MKIHSVTGGSGVKLHVREWGKPNAPAILFVHGWSQSYLCWQKQFESQLAEEFRLIAFDLRGHGMSEAPTDDASYSEPKPWADDVAAIIDQLKLNNVVLVGWSYGGFIICDYLREYGQDAVAGVNFVGGAVSLDGAALGVLIGPGFLDHIPGATAQDLPSNIQAVRDFMHGCTAQPLPQDDLENALCWMSVVPPKVRAAMIARAVNSDDVLSSLQKPVLMTQGDKDTVILPAMGDHILQICATSTASWYPDTGHASFLENPTRFNRELGTFTRRVSSAVLSKREMENVSA